MCYDCYVHIELLPYVPKITMGMTLLEDEPSDLLNVITIF